MPEIGYWKYVRFNDDEKQFFGTDEDITIVFDSADDRLEYRMKKDIRYEDDAGNEILTLDKANRHVEIPVQLNVAALEEYAAGAGITVKGSLTFSGADLDLAGNLLKNPKLGTDLKTNGYNICHGVADTARLVIGGGSTYDTPNGAQLFLAGAARPTLTGRAYLSAAEINNPDAQVILRTADTTPVLQSRIVINQGVTPDIELQNCVLNFSTGYPALETGKTATGEFLKIEVEGVTKFLALYA